MPRIPYALTALTVAVALGGCGGGDESTPDKAAERAANIAVQSDKLAADVRGTVRDLAGDQDARADARDALKQRADDARALADRARNELPEGTAGREQLEQANLRLADAVKRLDEAADPAGGDLDDAEASIADARTQLRGAADDVAGKLPDDAQKTLDTLRDQAP